MKNNALKYTATILLMAVAVFSHNSLDAKDNRERDFLFMEGLRMVNLGQLSGAEKIFTELTSKFPQMDAAYYNLANIHLKKR